PETCPSRRTKKYSPGGHSARTLAGSEAGEAGTWEHPAAPIAWLRCTIACSQVSSACDQDSMCARALPTARSTWPSPFPAARSQQRSWERNSTQGSGSTGDRSASTAGTPESGACEPTTVGVAVLIVLQETAVSAV